MKPVEQPLYPKLSSIYNKILQLAIAIMLIIFLLSFWVLSRDDHQAEIDSHVSKVGKMYLSQAANNSLFHLVSGQKQLQIYVNNLANERVIADVHIYDKTGLVLASSDDAVSMNDLYGISQQKRNKSHELVPFIQEVNDSMLQGYIRISLHRDLLADDLSKSNQKQFDMIKVLMAIAGIVGFLLTRGLNRFSRQGYRPPKKRQG